MHPRARVKVCIIAFLYSSQYKWFYLAFMNGVWVIIPGVLLAESSVRCAPKFLPLAVLLRRVQQTLSVRSGRQFPSLSPALLPWTRLVCSLHLWRRVDMRIGGLPSPLTADSPLLPAQSCRIVDACDKAKTEHFDEVWGGLHARRACETVACASVGLLRAGAFSAHKVHVALSRARASQLSKSSTSHNMCMAGGG